MAAKKPKKNDELSQAWKKAVESGEDKPGEHPPEGEKKSSPDEAESSEDGEEYTGRFGPIGPDQIKEAEVVMKKYKDGKSSVDRRIVENEQWWKLRHWEIVAGSQEKSKENDPRPVSAWLFNSLANKHADAMDNFPSPNILPREENDKEDAKTLSSIIPIVLERNQYEETYSDCWWYKLKAGTSVTGVFWDKNLENGLGDVKIRKVDLLNLFWEPGISKIQDSRNIFHVELVDNDLLEEKYDFLAGRLGSGTIDKAEYVYDDSIDTSEKSIVVDWYYKQVIGTRTVVQYCKFCNGEVLYASENTPEYAERGFYDHGKYPFVFDTLFDVEGSPAGFGYIDIMKDPQMYIDKLNQIIAKNAYLAGKPRWFRKKNCGVNVNQYADWSNDFVDVEGNLEDINLRQIEVNGLPPFITNFLQMRIDELKETSGNRDFSQGSTASGVTAASAIAALQEAGSKLSRDMIKTSYRAFSEINYLVLELIRQFYDEPRSFRLEDENGETDFQTYDNSQIKEAPYQNPMTGEEAIRRPIFDIKISAQKQSPFNRIAQNELAKEMYGMGWFNPQAAEQALIAIDMMEFEGKEGIKAKIQQNSQMMQDMQRLVQTVAQFDAQMGTNLLAMAGLAPPQQENAPAPAAGGVKKGESQNLGESAQVAKARTRAASTTVPKG